jgi:hypothetical protein
VHFYILHEYVTDMVCIHIYTTPTMPCFRHKKDLNRAYVYSDDAGLHQNCDDDNVGLHALCQQDGGACCPLRCLYLKLLPRLRSLSQWQFPLARERERESERARERASERERKRAREKERARERERERETEMSK